MIRRLSPHLLVSASLLAAAVIMLPSGCFILHQHNCSGDLPCADDHTEQVCVTSEGSTTISEQPCPFSRSCMDESPGFGRCVAPREGESCVTRWACADSPLCLDGKCSALPPAVVSACSAAPVLHVPSTEEGPDGATLATSFEPGELVVSAGLEFEGKPANFSDPKPCSAALPGSERVFTLELPAASPADASAEIALVLTIEGLDPEAVSAVSTFALETCGDPRALVWGECGRSPDSAVFTLDFIDLRAQTWSFVLQAPEAVTKSVPFTVRARLVTSTTK